MLLHHRMRWMISLVLLLGVIFAPAAQAGRGPIQLNDNRAVGFEQDPVISTFMPILPLCPPGVCTGVKVFGRVIASPHIVALYWDDAWDTDPTNASAPTRATINAMIQGIVASPYLDAARQYGVGRGIFHSAHQSFRLCATQRPTGQTSYASLAAWVECMVELPGTGVPYPDENTMYAVFLPDGVTITGSPNADCNPTAAFHAFSAAVVSDPMIINPFAFRVQGYPITIVPQQCMHAADAPTLLDHYSQAWSHELVEAATDTAPPTGWVDNTHAPDLVPWLNTGEAGDLCQPSASPPDGMPTPPVRSFTTSFLLVDTYWSNVDHRCVPVAPVPPPPAGVDPVGVIDREGADMGTTAFVEGFVYDGDFPTTPTHVQVSVDGPVGGSAPVYDDVANLIRADVAQAYPGASPDHGFDISIPHLPPGTHQLYVYGVNLGSGTDALIGQVSVSIPLPVAHPPTTSLSLVGGIEPTGIRVAGTAVSTLDPSATLMITAYIDGVPGQGTPYTLGATAPGGGFDATIGGLSAVDHTIHVYASDPAAGAEVLVGVGRATPPFFTAPLIFGGLPIVAGQPLVGSELTCIPAVWTATDGGVVIPTAWAWLRDSIVLPGVGGETYTPVAGDGGHRIACAESAASTASPWLSNTVVSDSVLVSYAPPVNVAIPSLRGEGVIGTQVACSTGTWQNAPYTFDRQWLRGKAGLEIPGATDPVYTPTEADLNATIRCQVTATNDGGPTAAVSTGVTVTAPPPPPPAPVVVTAPGITGSAVVGSDLSCSTGTWTNSPTGYSYVWSRAGVALGVAMPATYTVVVADVGLDVTCTVTASNQGGDGSSTSAAVVPTPLAPMVVTRPAITGSAIVGSSLACSTGTWTNAPTAYAYVWSRAGVALGTAMPPSHTVVVADVGKAITCTVTASNGGGGASATSAPVLGRALVQCVVPAVAKATLAVARARLAAAHCGVGKITKARSRTISRGRVIRSTVAAGSRHAVGFRVALVVSLGK